jgi:hypothetical protein
MLRNYKSINGNYSARKNPLKNSGLFRKKKVMKASISSALYFLLNQNLYDSMGLRVGTYVALSADYLAYHTVVRYDVVRHDVGGLMGSLGDCCRDKHNKRRSMKTVRLAKIGLYSGVLVGFVSYVLIWLLPVSYLFGSLGSKLGTFVFGSPNGLVTGLSMGIGVLAAGIVFTAALAVIGWVSGTLADVLKMAVVALLEKTSGQENELLAAEKDSTS